jgi:hypothetical protein
VKGLLTDWRGAASLLALAPLVVVLGWSGLKAGRAILAQGDPDLKARRNAYLVTAFSAFTAWVSIFALTRADTTPFAGRIYAILFLCATPLAWVDSLSGILQVGSLPPGEEPWERTGMLWYHRVVVFAPFLILLTLMVASKLSRLKVLGGF